MSAGVPVVATAVGGIPEILVDGESALLVEKRNIGQLASATAGLLLDQNLRERLATSAREIVSRRTPQAYFQSLTSVFEAALQ